MKFMNLPEEYSTDESKYHIIPMPLEGIVTYGRGAKNGPNAILRASKHLEYYDEEYDIEPFLNGIKTHEDIQMNLPTIKGTPIILGGDHGITIRVCKQLSKKQDFDVIILDAHADFRYSWQDSLENHACVSRRLVENHRVEVYGVRAIDKDEREAAAQDERMNIQFMHEQPWETNLDHLKEKIYLSIDVDVLDPAIISGTGTPEPGGLQFRELTSLINKIIQQKEIIGIDIVEYSPNMQEHSEAYTIARLIQKIISMLEKKTTSPSYENKQS